MELDEKERRQLPTSSQQLRKSYFNPGVCITVAFTDSEAKDPHGGSLSPLHFWDAQSLHGPGPSWPSFESLLAGC